MPLLHLDIPDDIAVQAFEAFADERRGTVDFRDFLRGIFPMTHRLAIAQRITRGNAKNLDAIDKDQVGQPSGEARSGTKSASTSFLVEEASQSNTLRPINPLASEHTTGTGSSEDVVSGKSRNVRGTTSAFSTSVNARAAPGHEEHTLSNTRASVVDFTNKDSVTEYTIQDLVRSVDETAAAPCPQGANKALRRSF